MKKIPINNTYQFLLSWLLIFIFSSLILIIIEWLNKQIIILLILSALLIFSVISLIFILFARKKQYLILTHEQWIVHLKKKEQRIVLVQLTKLQFYQIENRNFSHAHLYFHNGIKEEIVHFKVHEKYIPLLQSFTKQQPDEVIKQPKKKTFSVFFVNYRRPIIFFLIGCAISICSLFTYSYFPDKTELILPLAIFNFLFFSFQLYFAYLKGKSYKKLNDVSLTFLISIVYVLLSYLAVFLFSYLVLDLFFPLSCFYIALYLSPIFILVIALIIGILLLL